jgi:phosphoribosylformylglycinamidine synthase subunit PurQ / glutaminase
MARRVANALVLITAGSNCDRETISALEMAGAMVSPVHINDLIAGKVSMSRYQILVLPGGFTFGDDISSGRVLANKIKAHLSKDFKAFVKEGKLVLGICNGFQALVKMGLLPNLGKKQKQEVTLTFNNTARFEDRWVYLAGNLNSPCVFTRELHRTLYLPIAHAEGRFVVDKPATLKQLKKGGQIVFQYAGADGRTIDDSVNPNGSTANIAGICDASGRIFGMMPHPERYVNRLQHPRWTRESLPDVGDGLVIFQNAVEYALNEL